jgi:UDPglucose 6-dehydrogenase
VTGWPQYQELDFEKVFAQMEQPAFLFDGCNLLDHEALAKIGFCVYRVGAAPLSPPGAAE